MIGARKSFLFSVLAFHPQVSSENPLLWKRHRHRFRQVAFSGVHTLAVLRIIAGILQFQYAKCNNNAKCNTNLKCNKLYRQIKCNNIPTTPAKCNINQPTTNVINFNAIFLNLFYVRLSSNLLTCTGNIWLFNSGFWKFLDRIPDSTTWGIQISF